ncbi:MAG: aminopeptidase P family protein [Alphaproteobacteria bacterium]|nr:aminopeptidase P family protein [Alphaproteobacteria bacterium]MBM4073723.1 aminopeptidase P family protein [Planctomycetota bacterium]
MSKPELPFDDAEFARRLAAVRQGMASKGIDVLMTSVPENIYYLTGYDSMGYFSYQVLIVPVDQDMILLTRALNVDKASMYSCLKRVEGWDDLSSPAEATYATLAKYGLGGKRLANQNDAWFLSVAHYKHITSRLGKGDMIDGSGIVEVVRLKKSPQEIAYIRKAGEVCIASLDAAIRATRAGTYDHLIAADAHRALIAAGGEYLGHALQVCSGTEAGLSFETWGRRQIKTDDCVYMEMGGTYRRYNIAMSRTVLVGQPDARLKKMAEVSTEALAAARAAFKPGATSGEVDAAARNLIAKAGLADAFKHRTGYSIGIGYPPDWGEGRLKSIMHGDTTVLEPGMVFHLIPDLKLAGLGGAVCSETLLVTDKGHEVLTPYTYEIARK